MGIEPTYRGFADHDQMAVNFFVFCDCITYVLAASTLGPPCCTLIRSLGNICRAYQDGSVRFDTAREIFASCDLFNGLAICSEYFEFVPVVPIEMIVQSLLADDALDSLIPVETPEHDYIPIGVIPFFRSGEYQFLVFPCNLPGREFTGPNSQPRKNFPRAG